MFLLSYHIAIKIRLRRRKEERIEEIYFGQRGAGAPGGVSFAHGANVRKC
jgi:hypothetical protein